MKKLSILFAMIFAVSMAMAQNSSTTTQDGDNNSATITQGGSLNSSTVDQQDGYNTATVDQTGKSNQSNVFSRTTWSATGENVVDVDQDGEDNISAVNQWNAGNDATVDQSGGNLNWALVNQAQGGNVSSITQVGTENFSDVATSGGFSTQEVYQEGSRNIGNILSGNGTDNSASISQVGDDNYAGDKSWTSTRQGINQQGSFNNASISVVGDLNNTNVDQTNDNNSATVIFNEAGIGKSSGNIVDVMQEGTHNSILVTQRRGDIGGDDNTVDVDQSGAGHMHRVYLDGSGNNITINASGNVNGSQYAGNKGDWSITNGSPVWNETSDDNTLLLTQNGSRNFATGRVAGDSNDINISQDGEGNMVGSAWHLKDGVVVSGDWNDVDIMQTGIGNSSMNSINGNSNVISVTQSN